MPLSPIVIRATDFKDEETERLLTPLIDKYNRLVNIHNHNSTQETIKDIQAQFNTIAAHINFGKAWWEKEQYFFSSINDEIKNESIRLTNARPTRQVNTSPSPEHFSELLTRLNINQLIRLKNIKTSGDPKVDQLQRNYKFEILSEQNNYIMKVTPNTLFGGTPFILSFNLHKNKEDTMQKFKKRESSYFSKTFFQTYAMDGKKLFNVKVTPFMKGGSLDQKLKRTTDPAEFMKYFSKMSIVFQKLHENQILFTDAKAANFLVGDNNELIIADTKAYIPYETPDNFRNLHKKHTIWYSNGYFPPEWEGKENLDSEKIYVYFIGANLMHYYIPNHLNDKNAFKVCKLILRCCDQHPKNRPSLKEIETILASPDFGKEDKLNKFQIEFMKKQKEAYVNGWPLEPKTLDILNYKPLLDQLKEIGQYYDQPNKYDDCILINEHYKSKVQEHLRTFSMIYFEDFPGREASFNDFKKMTLKKQRAEIKVKIDEIKMEMRTLGISLKGEKDIIVLEKYKQIRTEYLDIFNAYLPKEEPFSIVKLSIKQLEEKIILKLKNDFGLPELSMSLIEQQLKNAQFNPEKMSFQDKISQFHNLQKHLQLIEKLKKRYQSSHFVEKASDQETLSKLQTPLNGSNENMSMAAQYYILTNVSIYLPAWMIMLYVRYISQEKNIRYQTFKDLFKIQSPQDQLFQNFLKLPIKDQNLCLAVIKKSRQFPELPHQQISEYIKNIINSEQNNLIAALKGINNSLDKMLKYRNIAYLYKNPPQPALSENFLLPYSRRTNP